MVSGPLLRVLAFRADGSFGDYQVSVGEAGLNLEERSVSWASTAAVPLLSPSGDTVGTLRSASIYVRQYPPRITVNYSLQAGADTTSFVVLSGLVHFPPVRASDSVGRANTTLTLTDMNLNGAEVHALGANAGVFSGFYDGDFPNGTSFSTLVSRIIVGAGGSASATQTDPSSGMRAVGSRLWNASSESAFSLTAGDRLYGTTRFDLDSTGNPMGDMNCDNRVNNLDIDGFILALTDREAYQEAYPCDWTNGDVNDDQSVDNFDMDSFVALLTL